MNFRELTQQAQMLVSLAKQAWEDAVRRDPSLRKADFHAAAVLASGHICTETTLQLGPDTKIPAILRAISELAREQDDHDRDIAVVAVYGAEPGQDPRIHAPCNDCMRKLLAFDRDQELDIVVIHDGRLMLTKMKDLIT